MLRGRARGGGGAHASAAPLRGAGASPSPWRTLVVSCEDFAGVRGASGGPMATCQPSRRSAAPSAGRPAQCVTAGEAGTGLVWLAGGGRGLAC